MLWHAEILEKLECQRAKTAGAAIVHDRGDDLPRHQNELLNNRDNEASDREREDSSSESARARDRRTKRPSHSVKRLKYMVLLREKFYSENYLGERS